MFFICHIFHFILLPKKALTEDGQQVLLYEDGTWKPYIENSGDSSSTTDSIKLNLHEFVKPSSSIFLIKSKVVNTGVYIDPAKCVVTAHKDNEINPEYRFNLKSGNGYAIMITEKTPIDLSYMPNIALVNAEKEAPDARIITKEYRMVNNKKIMMIQMRATIKNIKFVYFGYYYSNDEGTVQLISYTTENLFEKVKGELENLLNGFIEMH